MAIRGSNNHEHHHDTALTVKVVVCIGGHCLSIGDTTQKNAQI